MVDLRSPFYSLWSSLFKSNGQKLFHVEMNDQALKQFGKMGSEEQKRVHKVIGRVHGTPVNVANPHMTRLNESQHLKVGLDPEKRNGYTLGDYRVRMMGELNGHRLTIFDVGTRESSKHTGRTAR